jgi:quinol monooxygenase YgiN
MTGLDCQLGITKSSEMIVSTTRITVHPDKRGEFFQTIKRLVEPINAAKGCRTFRLYFDATDENSSLLMGEWETEVDLSNYLSSNDFAILCGAITVLSTQYTNFHGIVASSKDHFEFARSR